MDVEFSESIKLHCAAGGLPRPRVVWYVDDEPLMTVDNGTDGIYVLDDGWTLLIDGAQLSHAGRYVCRAVNVAGDDQKLFNLTVLGQSSPFCRLNVIIMPAVVRGGSTLGRGARAPRFTCYPPDSKTS